MPVSVPGPRTVRLGTRSPESAETRIDAPEGRAQEDANGESPAPSAAGSARGLRVPFRGRLACLCGPPSPRPAQVALRPRQAPAPLQGPHDLTGVPAPIHVSRIVIQTYVPSSVSCCLTFLLKKTKYNVVNAFTFTSRSDARSAVL